MHLSIFLLYAGYTPDDVYGEAQEQAEAEEVWAHTRKVQQAAEVGRRPERRANACVRGRWVGQDLHSATSCTTFQGLHLISDATLIDRSGAGVPEFLLCEKSFARRTEFYRRFTGCLIVIGRGLIKVHGPTDENQGGPIRRANGP